MKLCSHCREQKPVSEFYACTSRPDGLSFRCKTCDLEAKRISRSKHREGRNRWQCEHRKLPRVRQSDKEWRQRYYLKNRGKALAASRLWRTNNPKTMTWLKYKNSARARSIEFRLTREVFDELVGGRCYYCDCAPRPINGIDRIDSTMGYTLDNCVTSCKPCNTAKWDRTQTEFLSWLGRAYVHTRRLEGIDRAS